MSALTSSSATTSVGILTLGCPKNEVDSDKMAAVLASEGYDVVDDWQSADVVVVNSCSFIQDATEQSIVTTLEVAESIAGTDRKLILAGCMASRYGAGLLNELPEVHALAPVDDEHLIADIVAGLVYRDAELGAGPSAHHGRVAGAVTDLDDVELRGDSGPSAYIKIADGCSRECTFCSIPSFRGPYRSRPVDSIVREAEALAERGAREIVLIAQDTSSYGQDLGPNAPSLGDVVSAVAGVANVRWVRVMYIQPSGMTDELLDVMASNPKVVRYVEMPLQHASRSVLRNMARPGDRAHYLDLIGRVRAAMPDVVLRTTVMVGFPGETEDDFSELLSFIEEASFDYVGVFIYSPEEGTKAAELEGAVDIDTASERMQQIIDLTDDIAWKRASDHIGSVVDVLIEEYDDDEAAWVGRYGGQAPDIDGTVVVLPGDADRPLAVGDIVPVTVVDSVLYDLIGEVTCA